MPTPSVSRAVLKFSRAALLCAVCIWSASIALELQADRLQQLAQSRYGAHGAQAAGAWLDLLRSAATLPERDKLERVNDFWNRSVHSGEDALIWKKPDYWATPLESLGKGAGDCEDYVIGKYFSLLRLGVAPEKLRFVYVRAVIGGPGGKQIAHMVLGYYSSPNAEPLVLDSLVSMILPASGRRDLIPVFSFNTEGVYISGHQTTPVDRLSRWRDLLSRMEREGIRP